MPPEAFRSASRRSDRSAIDCSRLSAMAAKCCSSPSISRGSALAARRSGRAQALVVKWLTSAAPTEQQHRGRVARTGLGTGADTLDRPGLRDLLRFGRRFCATTWVLPQAPPPAIRWKWQGEQGGLGGCGTTSTAVQDLEHLSVRLGDVSTGRIENQGRGTPVDVGIELLPDKP